MRSRYQNSIRTAGLLLCGGLLSHTPAGHAQQLVETPMLAVAHLGVNAAGQVERCGLELLGGEVLGNEHRFFDVSLYAYSAGRGMGKLTGSSGAPNAAPNQMTPLEIYGGWIRAQGKPAAMPTTELIAGESPKSKLYGADVVATLHTLYAIADGEPAQVSISWAPGRSTIYFGKPKLDPAQSAQFYQCMADLTKTIQKELDSEKSAGK